MTQAWRDHGPTIVVSITLLAVIGVVAAMNFSRRRFAEFAMVAGTVPWLVMAFTPQPAPSAVEWVPMTDLAAQAAGPPGVLFAQVVGNLLVLAAFGAFAPVRWRFLAHLGRLCVAAVAGSVAIEWTQYALDVGRVSSIDDVLLNATGALLAGLSSRRWWITSVVEVK